MFLMRFDLRAPGKDATERAALYRTAIEMAAWADERGCASIVLSEHHASDDGYLSSPLMMAAAMAAVTSSVPILVAATLLPLHEPVRLAEELVALDHISEGRAMVVLGLGYRPEEYELHGVSYPERARVADEKLARLLELLADANDATRPIRITPAPFTTPMPTIAWGGGSLAAARRAGRHGISFFAQGETPGLSEAYHDAALDHGHEPGMCIIPSPDMPLIVFVADDLDTSWAEIGPAMLVDAVSYRTWSDAAGTTPGTASLSGADNVEDLRRSNGAHRIVTPEDARAIVEQYGVLGLHPLCGGLDPDVAWRHLHTAVDAIEPKDG